MARPMAALAALILPLADGAVPPAERQALVDLFHALGGPKWRNGTGAGRWLSGDPCQQKWFGVACNNASTHVTEIYPSSVGSGNSLVGTLPPSIGDFPQLQHLVSPRPAAPPHPTPPVVLAP
eukprot:COSAG04_NODE_1548_length_6381_cov_42.332697_5_plen_122_part_00